jgi:hypothetical protein
MNYQIICPHFLILTSIILTTTSLLFAQEKGHTYRTIKGLTIGKHVEDPYGNPNEMWKCNGCPHPCNECEFLLPEGSTVKFLDFDFSGSEEGYIKIIALPNMKEKSRVRVDSLYGVKIKGFNNATELATFHLTHGPLTVPWRMYYHSVWPPAPGGTLGYFVGGRTKLPKKDDAYFTYTGSGGFASVSLNNPTSSNTTLTNSQLAGYFSFGAGFTFGTYFNISVSNRPTTYCGSALHTTADKYPEVSSYWAANHQFC